MIRLTISISQIIFRFKLTNHVLHIILPTSTQPPTKQAILQFFASRISVIVHRYRSRYQRLIIRWQSRCTYLIFVSMYLLSFRFGWKMVSVIQFLLHLLFSSDNLCLSQRLLLLQLYFILHLRIQRSQFYQECG